MRLLPITIIALVLVLVPSADASLRARTLLETRSGATRIVVKLTSPTKLAARATPRAVSVKAGTRSFKLTRVRGARAAVAYGTWRSSAYRGQAATRVRALAGKNVTVRVRSRRGTKALSSRVVAAATSPTAPPPGPAPAPPPAGTQPAPAPPPGAPQPGDLTGQQAIDQMTAEIRGSSARRFQTSGDLSETFELHLCDDGAFRHYHHQSYIGSPSITRERFGNPWTVVEALVRADGSYRGARVQGTFTQQNSSSSGQQAINEPAEALLEHQGGQWYWDKQPVETGTASCAPTF